MIESTQVYILEKRIAIARRMIDDYIHEYYFNLLGYMISDLEDINSALIGDLEYEEE